MASKNLPIEKEGGRPRSLRKILDTENPKVVIEFTEERVNFVDFVQDVLNFDNETNTK